MTGNIARLKNIIKKTVNTTGIVLFYAPIMLYLYAYVLTSYSTDTEG